MMFGSFEEALSTLDTSQSTVFAFTLSYHTRAVLDGKNETSTITTSWRILPLVDGLITDIGVLPSKHENAADFDSVVSSDYTVLPRRL